MTSESLRERINVALNAALKAQDRRRTSTLRLVNAAIKDRAIRNRGAGREDGVSEDEILDILSKMVKQREESERIYEDAGRIELAQQERQEIEVISDFLPRQLTEEEIAAAVDALIAEFEATGLKDMGRVMGALKERYAGQLDFAAANRLAKVRLGG